MARTRPGGSSRSGSSSDSNRSKWLLPFPRSRSDLLQSFISPFTYGLERTPWGFTQGIGHVLGGIGSGPAAMALYPREVPGQGWGAVRGIAEAPIAIGKAYQQDWAANPDRSPFLLAAPGNTVKMIFEGMKLDFKERYGADWYKHAKNSSLYNTFDLLSVLGGAARGAALAGAAERLGEVGQVTARNLWRESSRPGLISTGEMGENGRWLEGSPFTREISYQPETGTRQVATQTYSRSPLMREIQDVNTAIAERLPNAPIFGAVSRVQRTRAATMSRVMDRALGEVVGEETLNALGDDGRSRLYWESQLQDLPSEDGNTTMLKRLRDALADAYKSDFSDIPDPELREVLLAAKKMGFGEQVILKKLDAAMKYDVTSGKNKRRYESAWAASRQATNLAERTSIDSDGFTALKNDLVRAQARLERIDPGGDEYTRTEREIERLTERLANKTDEMEEMFANRKNLVLDWLNTKGKNKYSEAWLDVLTKALGAEKARRMIAIAMVRANQMRPDNPESYWADKIGMPDPKDLTAGGAAAFRERKGLDALFQDGEDVMYAPEYDPRLGEWQLIEGSAESPLEGSAFYSPTQKWVAESDWGPKNQKTVAQLRSAIIKEAGQDEYYNSGLDTYFQALDNNTVIKKGEFLNVLANRLNAYNLKQVVRINAHRIEGDPSGEGTRFDTAYDGAYISRGKFVNADGRNFPDEGEYYEVTFELPGPGRDTAYRGKGWGHWNHENVVAHFRFHVFMEDGKKKMLIEEIQSDWANQWREAENLRRKMAQAPPEDLEGVRRIRADLEDVQEEYRTLRQQQEDVGEQINRATGNDPDPNLDARELTHEWQELDNRMFGLRQDIAEYWRMLDETGIDDDMGGLSDIPRSVLGTGTGKQSSYINSPIRWMGRFAVENNVDEVILVSREVQLVRNSRIDMRMWHELKKDVKGGFASLKDRLREAKEGGRDYIGYETDIPQRMLEEWGVKGVRSEEAYEGFFRHPLDASSPFHGKLPGIVFKVDDVFRTEAMKPKSMYQRPPDWNGLPKGATELFAGGKSRIHLFKNGDVSTWIHELGHVALGDLGPEDLRVVEGHFGQGKSYLEWTEMQHEDFARAFEQYVREGVAPTRPLQSVFKRLSEWISQVWDREKRVAVDMPPEVSAVMARLFQTNKGPTVFMPHRPGAPDLAGGRVSRAQARANREIGTEVQSRIPLFKKNQLALMLSGMINDDPRLIMEHANRVVALARANQLREMVLDMAEPLRPGTMPKFETQYVVKKAGRGVDKATFDALESADDANGVRHTIENFIDDHISDDPEDFKKWKEWEGEDQLYVVDKKSTDLLFKYITGKAPGAATKPTGNTIKVIDAALDSVRGLLLYANPGFYMTNMVGNSAMLMLKDPASAKYIPFGMREALKASTRPEAADPMWQHVTTEMGRGPTSGAFSLGSINNVLSGKPGEKGNLPGRAAEWWSHGLGEWGRRSGRVIDDAFRYAAWRQSAAKLGYDTDAKVKALFEHESVKHPFKGKAMDLDSKELRDLAAIRAEAEQLMLDFDSMTPAERAYLQRGLFLYPFTKAAVKYPFYFAGERPITSGLLMEAGHQGELAGNQIWGERPDLPLWLQGYARGPFGGYTNVGSFSPFNMPLGIMETILNLRGPSETGIQRPIDYTNPVVQILLDLARQQNEYGREVPSEQIFLGEAPLPAYLRYPIRKPSEQYSERDFWNTLLRSLRIFPTELSAGMGEGPSRSGGGSTRTGEGGSRRTRP